MGRGRRRVLEEAHKLGADLSVDRGAVDARCIAARFREALGEFRRAGRNEDEMVARHRAHLRNVREQRGDVIRVPNIPNEMVVARAIDGQVVS